MFEYEIAVIYFFFKQKTAYEIRIRDWSSDVCSSDLPPPCRGRHRKKRPKTRHGKIWHAPCDGACNGQGTSGGFPPPSRKDEKRWNRKPPISSAARIPSSGFARPWAVISASTPCGCASPSSRRSSSFRSDELRFGQECVRTCRL